MVEFLGIGGANTRGMGRLRIFKSEELEMNWTNLDMQCAAAAERIFEGLGQPKKQEIVALCTSSGTVLAENGLYACFLYLWTKGTPIQDTLRKASRESAYALLSEVFREPLAQRGEPDKSSMLSGIRKLSEDLPQLLLAKSWYSTFDVYPLSCQRPIRPRQHSMNHSWAAYHVILRRNPKFASDGIVWVSFGGPGITCLLECFGASLCRGWLKDLKKEVGARKCMARMPSFWLQICVLLLFFHSVSSQIRC